MNITDTKKQVFLIFFLALFLLVARLFYPFLTVIIWSGLLYAFLEPLFEKLTSNMGHRNGSARKRPLAKTITAGLFSFLGVFILVVPFIYLFISLLRQVVDLAGNLIRLAESHPDIISLSPTSPVGGFLFKVSGGTIDLSSINVAHELKMFLTNSSSKIIGLSGTLLKNSASLLVTLAFMVFTLYFLLMDGKALFDIVVSAIPIEKSYTAMFMKKLRESGKHLVLGFFLVALYQAFAMFILALAFQFKSPLVLAFLTAISSFIPMVGTGLVWGPLVLYLGLTGSIGKAVLFLLCAGFFISFVDNFLRPMVLGNRLSIHPLLIFFAIVGGLSLFGFNGLILGPLILIIFFSAVELYEMQDQSADSAEEKRGKSS